MPGIGIILNPHSRSNKKNPERIHRLGFIVGDKGSCRQTHDIVDLPHIVREFKAKEIDVLGISGGDGTNHCTLSTFIEEYGDQPLPKIAFLRGGTMNTIAYALGIHGSPEQILSNLILKYHEDIPFETSAVNLLDVNGKLGFLFGNGLISRFIDLYYRKKKGGPVSAFWLLFRVAMGTLFNTEQSRELCERFDADVTIDGKPWRFKNYTFITAGTMETFSYGFHPLLRAREKPDHFQMWGCTQTPRGVVSTLPRIILKMKYNPRDHEDYVGKESVIKLAKPQSYMIDGDMQEPTDLIKIKTGPKLNIIIR